MDLRNVDMIKKPPRKCKVRGAATRGRKALEVGLMLCPVLHGFYSRSVRAAFGKSLDYPSTSHAKVETFSVSIQNFLAITMVILIQSIGYEGTNVSLGTE